METNNDNFDKNKTDENNNDETSKININNKYFIKRNLF